MLPSSPKLCALRAFAGVGTFGVALALAALFPSSADLAPGWHLPILAFEFAARPDDVAFLTGDEGQPLRLAMDAGHHIETVFPFFYAGLLALSAVGRRPRMLAGVVIGLAVAALAADLAENRILLVVSDAIAQNMAPPLAWLPFTTWVKWIAIGAAMGCLSFLLDRRPVRAICGIAAVASVVGLIFPVSWLLEGMATTVMFGFAALILSAIYDVLPTRRTPA